jgi:hypothetical protein
LPVSRELAGEMKWWANSTELSSTIRRMFAVDLRLLLCGMFSFVLHLRSCKFLLVRLHKTVN